MPAHGGAAMSWDADLIDDRGHYEGQWNYTHNTNRMMNAALDDTGYERPPNTHAVIALDDDGEWRNYPNGKGQQSWWRILDGMDGPAGAAFLDRIIRQLEADPAKYKAMNPENGWGSYLTLLPVLREMRDRVPEWPCVWRTFG